MHQRYWPVIFFIGSVFVWFWYQQDGGFIERLWECSFLFRLLEESEKDLYDFFVYFVELICEAISSWTSVFRELCFFLFFPLVTGCVSLLVTSLFKLSVSSWLSLADSMFLETYSFLLSCPICCHMTIHSSILRLFVCFYHSYFSSSATFCCCCCYFVIDFSNFSSWWAWQKICQFCLTFQKAALNFIDLFYYFWFYFIYFLSHLYYFIPSTDFGFCFVLFSDSFRW